MKKLIPFVIIIIIFFAESIMALELEKEWSIKKDIIDWHISYSGNYIALINEDNYYIYDTNGDVFLEGKNIWKAHGIEVTDHEFMLKGFFERSYNEFSWNYPYFRIFNYNGEFIRKGIPVFLGNYFSPHGNFVLSGYGYEVFAFSNSKGQIPDDNKVISDSLPYHPYISFEKDNQRENYDIFYSNEERFVVTKHSGVFENKDGNLIQIKDYYDLGYFNDMAFINNSTYILIKKNNRIYIDNRYQDNFIYEMYDDQMNLLWERDDIQGKLYGSKNGFLTTDKNLIVFYDINGQAIHNVELSEEIKRVFTFADKDFAFLQMDESLLKMDLRGNILGKVKIEHPFVFLSSGERVFKLYIEDDLLKNKNNYTTIFNTAQIEIISYGFKY
ncbi:hypothetical protein [Natronospora cellulosivora (SeqCode)]